MEEINGSAEFLPQVAEPEVSKKTKELFRKGIINYQADKIDKAVEIFESIISTNPELSEAYVNLGDSYYRQNRIQEAINCWKKALSQDLSLVVCYVNMGNAHYATGNVDEAISNWLTAVSIAPDHQTALMNLGAAFENMDELTIAYRYFEEYIKHSVGKKTPEYKKIFTKITHLREVAIHNLKAGIQFQKRGKLKKAAMAYMKSIETYPNFSKAHHNMGSICYMAFKFEHAIKFWIQAIKLDSSNINTYCNLGVAYEKTKQYSYAYCMYSRYLKSGSVNNVEKYTINERLTQIKAYLDKHPEKTKIHVELAEKHYKENKFDDALLEYENHVILNPALLNSFKPKISEIKDKIDPVRKAANVAFEIASTCYGQQKYDKALNAYRRYLNLMPRGEHADESYKKILKCGKLINA